MSLPQRTQRIVIVGSGLAASMTAAALSVGLAGLNIDIIVLGEDADLQGAQSALPSICDFLESIGLQEREFIQKTDATFKLATVYRDWNQQGSEAYVGFGEHGSSINGLDFNQFVTKFCQRGVPLAYGGFCVASLAAAMGRFSPPSRNTSNVLSSFHYAYHFDTQKFCDVLDHLALAKGVVRQRVGVRRVHRSSERGEINRLELEDGSDLEADLYVDCTDAESVLLGDALEESEWHLKTQTWDTQWTISTELDSASLPLTSVKALPNGILKAFPLQGRTCYQLFVNSSETQADSAQTLLREYCQGQWQGSPHKRSVRMGHSERAWVGNCLAIGEAAAVLDTLSVDATHPIQAQLKNLLSLLSSAPQPQASKNEFNRLHRSEVQHVVDWHDAHYDSAKAFSTAFWKTLSAGPWSDTLNYKLDLFSQRGRLALYDNEIFSPSTWHALFYGMGRVPLRYDPLVDGIEFTVAGKHLKKIQSMMQQAVSKMPEHAQFLNELVNHE